MFRLISQLKSSNPISKTAVVNLVQECFPTSSDMIRHVIFDPTGYNRKVVYDNPEFQVVMIAWRKNQETDMHGHDGKTCVYKVVSGSLLENVYSNNTHSFSHLQSGKTYLMNDKIGKHKMSSPISDSVSLHVYFQDGTC